MRRPLAIAIAVSALLLPVHSVAQTSVGEIFGKATDESGAVLPGVTITLESPSLIRPFNTVTSARGTYLAPSLPIGSYRVRFELAGFSRVVREGVKVETGFAAEVNGKLKVSSLEETVTVSGEAPIIDTKSQTLAATFTRDMLENIPSARDPWVIIEQVPGMVMDRQNVGGNQSGQQASFLAHGSATNQVWNMDGGGITDMAADSSPSYYDFDSFEEIQITTGGGDASLDTGGIAVNLVTKSGSNSFRGSARFFLADRSLNATNSNSGIRAQGGGAGNPLENVQDYGIEFGGPIKRDRAWFWGSASQNDIKVGVVGFLKPGCTDGNDPDCLETDLTVLKNYNGKINYQWSRTHKSAFQVQYGDKYRGTRGASNLTPIEATVRQTAPGFAYFLQHQWFVSDNLMLESRANYVDGGFLLDFHEDSLASVQPTFDVVTQMNGRSATLTDNIRPTKEAKIDGTYFIADLLGGSHSTKFGVRGRWTPYQTITRTGGGATARFNNGVPVEASISRDGHTTRDLYEYSFYVNDSFRRGRFTVNAGARFDYQKDEALAANIPANPILPNLLPAVDFKGADSGAAFEDLAPRFSMTYDVSGDGKTILKATAARYYGLGIFTAGNLSPTGQTTLRYPWNDRNGDRFVQANELDLTRLLASSANYNPQNPAAVVSPVTVDPNLENDITNEFLLGIEREFGRGIGVGVTLMKRRYYNYNTTFRVGLSSENYIPVTINRACGNSSCDQPNYTVQYFQLPFTQPAAQIQRNHLDGREYKGVEFTARRRFSSGWMANASFTWNSTRRRYAGGPNVDYLDPTNVDQQDGEPVGTSNARWVAKFTGMVSLPAGINLSAFVNARDGFPFNRTILSPTRTGGIGTVDVFVRPYGAERYPTFFQVDGALDKTVKLGKAGVRKLVLSVAAFNVLNSNVVLGRTARQNSSLANNITTILAPRTLRLGARLTF